MDRVQVNKDCFQCRYGSEETEEANAWCYEACRKIDDMSSIPEWCPLPIFIPDDENNAKLTWSKPEE